MWWGIILQTNVMKWSALAVSVIKLHTAFEHICPDSWEMERHEHMNLNSVWWSSCIWCWVIMFFLWFDGFFVTADSVLLISAVRRLWELMRMLMFIRWDLHHICWFSAHVKRWILSRSPAVWPTNAFVKNIFSFLYECTFDNTSMHIVFFLQAWGRECFPDTAHTIPRDTYMWKIASMQISWEPWGEVILLIYFLSFFPHKDYKVCLFAKEWNTLPINSYSERNNH